MEAKEAKTIARFLRDNIISLKEKMSLLSNLVEILKEKCIKAYKSKVSFMISKLKTQAKKLDLIVPYFTLMQVFRVVGTKLFLPTP